MIYYFQSMPNPTENRPRIVLGLLLTFFLAPVGGYPFEETQASMSSYDYYSPSLSRSFTTVVSGTLESCWIEHDFYGITANYSMSTDGNYCYYTADAMPAGNFSFRIFGNDTDSNVYASDAGNYVVSKTPTFGKVLIDSSDYPAYYLGGEISNLTYELYSEMVELPNPGFEQTRPDDLALPESWYFNPGYSFWIDDSETDAWDPILLIMSNESYSGRNSLIYNVSDLGADLLPGNIEIYGTGNLRILTSHSFPLAGNRYLISFKYKGDGLNSSCAFPYAIGDIDKCGEFALAVFDSENQILQEVEVLFNNTASLLYEPKLGASVSSSDLENGWREVELLIDGSLEPGSNKATLNFYSPDYLNTSEGFYYIDDVSVIKNSTIPANASLNSTLPGFTALSGMPPISHLENITAASGIYSVFGNFSGNENYSASDAVQFIYVGKVGSLVVYSDSSSYSQSDLFAPKFYANITANYTDENGAPISGSNCFLTSNDDHTEAPMNYDPSSGIHMLSLDTLYLYGDVNVTVTCEGNETYLPLSNSTGFSVSLKGYDHHYPLTSIAYGAEATTQFANRTPPSPGEEIIEGYAISTGNETTGTLHDIFFDGGGSEPAKSFDTTFIIHELDNITVRGNFSVDWNSSLAVSACMLILDSFGEEADEDCSDQQYLPASSVYSLLEFQFGGHAAHEFLYKGQYLEIEFKYNWTDPSHNITVNLSSLSALPLLEIHSFEKVAMTVSQSTAEQRIPTFSLGPNSVADLPLFTRMTLENAQSAGMSLEEFTFNLPMEESNLVSISNVTVRSSTNMTLPSELISDLMEGILTYSVETDTELVPAFSARNETIYWTCVHCLRDSETLLENTSTTKRWNVGLLSFLEEGEHVENVSVWTNLSTYGAGSLWSIQISYTNDSGAYDITGGSSIDYATGRITFKKIRLSGASFIVTATRTASSSQAVAVSSDVSGETSLKKSNDEVPSPSVAVPSPSASVRIAIAPEPAEDAWKYVEEQDFGSLLSEMRIAREAGISLIQEEKIIGQAKMLELAGNYREAALLLEAAKFELIEKMRKIELEKAGAELAPAASAGSSVFPYLAFVSILIAGIGIGIYLKLRGSGRKQLPEKRPHRHKHTAMLLRKRAHSWR